MLVLRQAKERGHIVEGLIVAIANIDEVIEIIKKSENTKVAADKLCERNWSAATIKPLLDKVADPDICKPVCICLDQQLYLEVV